MKNHEDSICWNCENACTKRCSWADEFIPVDGWEAEYCEKYGSYSVKSCPLFTSERVDPGLFDERGMMDLMVAALEVARDDYIESPRLRPDIEKWIRTKGAKLCTFGDPEGVIKKLRRETKLKDEERLIGQLSRLCDIAMGLNKNAKVLGVPRDAFARYMTEAAEIVKEKQAVVIPFQSECPTCNRKFTVVYVDGARKVKWDE